MARKESVRRGEAAGSSKPVLRLMTSRGDVRVTQASRSATATSISTSVPSQAGAASSQRAPKRRAARLGSVVAALTSKAISVARKAMALRPDAALPALRRIRRGAAAKTGGVVARRTGQSDVAARAKTPATPPVRRVSVVKKPPRGPGIRASRVSASRGSQPARSSQEPSSISSALAGEFHGRGPSPPNPSSPLAVTQAPRGVQAGEPYSIPTGYGDDRIVLMVKDPWWLYAYWEIQAEKERDVRSRLLPHEIAGLRSVLRVYDVTDRKFPAQPAHRWFDIALSGLANNWYIETNAPNRAFIADIGLLTQGGRFLLLARSNRVRTPRFGPSEVIDETWATTEEVYWKLFGAATPGFGSSPTSWARGLSRQVFSGAWSSPGAWSASRPALRGFWCWVRTDLIVYGATEPKATVTIQGQPVDVRKDGTFSLRLALPEGTQTLAVEARSSDGRFAKTITPIVTLGWEGGSPDTPPHGPPRSRVAFETREQISDSA